MSVSDLFAARQCIDRRLDSRQPDGAANWQHLPLLRTAISVVDVFLAFLLPPVMQQ
jgi:hypothetical protein